MTAVTERPPSQGVRIRDLERAEIASSTTAWIEGWGPLTSCCPRYEKCLACQGSPYPQRHRECWGMTPEERWGHGHSAAGRIGHVRGIVHGHMLGIYEIGYPHRSLCDCKDAGHPGIGEGIEGTSDLRWAERVGLVVVPPAPVIPTDGHGTPDLLAGLL